MKERIKNRKFYGRKKLPEFFCQVKIWKSNQSKCWVWWWTWCAKTMSPELLLLPDFIELTINRASIRYNLLRLCILFIFFRRLGLMPQLNWIKGPQPKNPRLTRPIIFTTWLHPRLTWVVSRTIQTTVTCAIITSPYPLWHIWE